MSRLSHRQLDRHIDEQEEEIQWRREQDELDAQSNQLSYEADHEKALEENERIRRQEELDEYFDELWRMENEFRYGGDDYRDGY